MTSEPPSQVVDHLRQHLADPRTSDNYRVKILFALRQLDGLNPLREIRDNPKTPPPTRWTVSDLLRDRAQTDRSTGAQVLAAVAEDSTCPPALRWRAGRDLNKFGERGREMGVAALQALADDPSVPASARCEAAREIGLARPDLRQSVLRLLRTLRTTDKPLIQVKVLEAIGRFDAHEAAPQLRNLATNSTLPARVRLRAAKVVAQLHRDYRDRAAVVAKEVAFDEASPWHIRAEAARCLACWSEPCRAEAQALLSELLQVNT